MAGSLDGFVVAECGAHFSCGITHLTTRTLFLETDQPLNFGASVSVTFTAVEVRGTVAMVCRSPKGVLVSFEASPRIQHRIQRQIDRAAAPPPAAPPPGSLLPETPALGVVPLSETNFLEEPAPTEVSAVDFFEEDSAEITFPDDTGRLRRGLTSHAAAPRSSTQLRTEATREIRVRSKERPVARLDNVIPALRRPKPKPRDEDITDLDPSAMVDAS